MKVLVFLAAAALARPAIAEPVNLPAAGLTIERPVQWHQVSIEQNISYARRIGVGPPENFVAPPGHPFLSFVKNTGHAVAMPTVRVQMQMLPPQSTLTATRILEGVFTITAQAIPGTQITEGPTASPRFGPGGMTMRLAYTLRTADHIVPVRSQMWVMTRGDRVYSFSITMAEDEVASTWGEADAILDSVRIAAR